MADVGDQIALGAWTPIADDDDQAGRPRCGQVVIESPAELTSTEKEIVHTWFARGEQVRIDPWSEGIGNGRHRLWGTLPHLRRHDRLVPILSDDLVYAEAPEDFAQADYAGNYRDLLQVQWFDRSDPVNRQFLTTMRAASQRELPDMA